MPRRPRPKANARDLAEEIIRRLGVVDGAEGNYFPYVIRLSDPPTAHQRLQLMACRMLSRQIAIMPMKSLTVDEWIERYGQLGQ